MWNWLLLRICDYIFVLRPLILIPAWSFYLIGAGDAMEQFPYPHALFPSPRTFICLTAILVTAYLLNQLFDRESDARNRKCPFLAEGIFGAKTLLILALGFYFIASLFFRKLGDAQRIPLLSALILSLIYSLPPIRLCARPFLDLGANAVGFGGIAYILGYGLFANDFGAAVRQSLPFVLLVGATFLHTTILDTEGDRATGKISTSVYIGERASRIGALLLHGLAVLAAVFFGTVTAVLLTAVTFPLSLYALRSGEKNKSSIHVQASTLIIALGAVVLWPVYLLILIPLVILSRYYHYRRFGIIYPGAGRNP